MIQLVILCYQLAVDLACPLNHHLSLPSLGSADASCVGNWTPLLEDCLSPVHTLLTEELNIIEKKRAYYTKCYSVVPTDGCQTLAPKESLVAVLGYRNPTSELSNSE